MKIGNHILGKNAITRMGQPQNAEDKTKANGTTNPAELLPEKNKDSLELSASAQAQIEASKAQENATQSRMVTGNTTSTGTTASSFATTSEYLAYLEDTYQSITNSNIEISETVLKQAMSDPEKEKVLTDFLQGLDGAKDFRSEQISGMSDDTYTYELKSFGIVLDSIADDNSGVNGTEFGEILVSRNDGTRMSDEEFAGVKSNVLEQLEEFSNKQIEYFKKIFEVISNRNDDNRVEENRKDKEVVETERLEDVVNEKIDEKREEMRAEMRKETIEKMHEDLRQLSQGENYSTKI
ncbi:MAG: hypothetical protein R3Y53_03645 [Bacillota bacterium]